MQLPHKSHLPSSLSLKLPQLLPLSQIKTTTSQAKDAKFGKPSSKTLLDTKVVTISIFSSPDLDLYEIILYNTVSHFS